MDDIVENNDVPELDLNLDYMVSLKLHLETEYNISENNDIIIFELIQYLRDMNVPIDKIKTAMYLLYDTIDPSKKNMVDSVLTPRIFSNTFLSSFANLITDDAVNEHTDAFTGDIINPANIINMFAQNLNNPSNNTFHITFDANTLLTQNNIFQFANVINFPLNSSYTTTENILEKNTQVIEYNKVDEKLRSKYETCFICLADFDDDNIIRIIKCEHIFHKECIDPWLLKESYKCPVCRSDLLAKDNTG